MRSASKSGICIFIESNPHASLRAGTSSEGTSRYCLSCWTRHQLRSERHPDGFPASKDAQTARELAAREQRLGELEQAVKSAVRDRELATALAGRPLVPGAAIQLIKLWREEFDIYEDGDSYKVSAKDGRSVDLAVSAWLASSAYSHFCLPTSRGGTGARDANRPSNGAAPSASPKNLGESIVMKWREEAASRPNNLLKPIGLRRHR